MRTPDSLSPAPAEALLHSQFGGWGGGGADGSASGSNGSSCPNSPGSGSAPTASSYALTLTPSHLHIQRLAPRSGKEARLLLPLAELAGCSCPRAPAPPLLVLYWYPPGRRRKGVSRRRQVRAYLAESRVEAERWSAAVQCLLRGVRVSSTTEFSRSLLPRPRRLLLLVNPFSGRGQAMQWCQSHILPMIREANISYNLIQTERQNHARELIREISLPEWDGIVIVSGDGLLHEVINGLMERPDWEQAIKTPVGILPCGSGNALAGSINHHAGYDMCLREPLLLNCCFLLCRGGVRPMDLVSVTTSPTSSQNGRPAPRRLFSFLSVAWGFVSDVDIESERYRGLGSARFTLGTLVRLASLRSYKGRLSYLPPCTVAPSPDTTPPPQKRLLSRSITEGLEGFCRTPIHRTISDMGLSEQRSLREGERERERQREKEERQKERQRRRQRARGVGVTRASSLAEDREREGALEAEEQSRACGADVPETEEMDESADEGMSEKTGQSEDELDEQLSEEKTEDTMRDPGAEDTEEQREGVVEARELSEGYGVDMGKEADESEGCDPYLSEQQMARRSMRKNSAPSSQIASAFFGQASVQGSSSLEGAASYGDDEMDMNGTYFQGEPFPLDVARERALTISSPFRHSPPLKNGSLANAAFNPPRDDLLPPLDQPLPTRDWVTIEGDFVLVLALYQTHLGADLHAAPQAKFDDGLIHLTFVRAGISRATLLRLFLAMERGAHLSLSSPYVSHVPARAFRLQPLSPRGTLTVDGELVPYGPLQAQVHPSMARLIVGDAGVTITRF
ncbi:hypothetical protein COCON_G00005310 [Conger conger]|uniref:sphingosine kinase n=1 Tax=Conger conger TaxID=82655 RepID=A0A9Q1E1E3_CONCO|nr:hypothetical protein COCON_G00005310 [Conger conger]